MFSRFVGMFSGNVDKPPVQVKQAALAEGVKVIPAAPASKTDVPSVMRRELDEQQNDALSALDSMNQGRTGAEQPVLATQFRHDPVLSARLLRYVNSPEMGLLWAQQVSDV